VDTLLAMGAAAGVCRHVVCSVATTPHQVSSVNRFIHATATANPDRITGLGALHPDSPDMEADVEMILALGLKGVKLHPDIQKFKIDDYRMLRIFDLCEEAGLPILMHTGDDRFDFSNPNRMKPILEIYKHLTVIGAHFGGWTVWEEALECLAEFPNFFVDSSSSFAFMPARRVGELIKAWGADKVLFGTDYPMWIPQNEIDELMKLGLSDEDYRKIFSENAKKVFSL